jgi:hypothetical protein
VGHRRCGLVWHLNLSRLFPASASMALPTCPRYRGMWGGEPVAQDAPACGVCPWARQTDRAQRGPRGRETVPDVLPDQIMGPGFRRRAARFPIPNAL